MTFSGEIVTLLPFSVTFAYMAANKREFYLALNGNKVIGSGRSMRDLSRNMSELGKSHNWYSRKFLDNSYFLFSFNNQVYAFQKIEL